MPSAEGQRSAETSKSPRLAVQFSLKSLLIVTTLLAVGLFLLTTVGWLLAVLAMIAVWVFLPTLLVILVVYARGNVRTFAIGAMVPLALWLLDPRTVSPHSSQGLIAAPLLGACCGGIAILLRRLIRQRGWDQVD